MKNWSMTVGEMRSALAGVPDDYEVVLDDADVEDCEISGLHIDRLMTPDESPGWCIEHGYMNCVGGGDSECLLIDSSPGLLVLGGGQIISAEYRYGHRLDAWLGQRQGRWDVNQRVWGK